MTTTRQRLTLEEYLAYTDATDKRYGLENGELVEIPTESDLNNLIAIYLIGRVMQVVPICLLRRGAEIVVSGSRVIT